MYIRIKISQIVAHLFNRIQHVPVLYFCDFVCRLASSDAIRLIFDKIVHLPVRSARSKFDLLFTDSVFLCVFLKFRNPLQFKISQKLLRWKTSEKKRSQKLFFFFCCQAKNSFKGTSENKVKRRTGAAWVWRCTETFKSQQDHLHPSHSQLLICFL